MSSDLSTAIEDRISNLQDNFFKREAENKKLAELIDTKLKAKEQLVNELESVEARLAMKQGELHGFTKFCTQLTEQQKSAKEVLSKEKEKQGEIFQALVDAEDAVAKLESDKIEHQYSGALRLRKLAEVQVKKRQEHREAIFAHLDDMKTCMNFK